jgi:hypothetical protein
MPTLLVSEGDTEVQATTKGEPDHVLTPTPPQPLSLVTWRSQVEVQQLG